jgi:hypothetical protein
MGIQLEQLDLGLDLLPAQVRLPAVQQVLAWAARRERPRLRFPDHGRAGTGVRFAFYGRVSTLEYQDPASSLGWQRDSALDVIADRGRIVTEFFDIGYSRTVPWARRRQAARLLEAVASPRREFDAILVGESERAFTGTQLLHGQRRTYRLAGLLQCGICGRRLDSHWVNNRPGYRCRHGHTSAHPANDHEDRERAVYLREDELLQDLASALRRGSGSPPAPQEVPATLRERKITIVCGHTHRTLVPAHAGPPSAMG